MKHTIASDNGRVLVEVDPDIRRDEGLIVVRVTRNLPRGTNTDGAVAIPREIAHEVGRKLMLQP